MSKAIYMGGADGTAIRVNTLYIGVDGVARKVTKGYIGDSNGVARLFYDSSSGSGGTYRVGGPIFYIADGDNGATYTFYDESGNVMTDITVGSTPYSYDISGTPTSDKYYVYYPTLDTTYYHWTYSTDDEYSYVYEDTGATGTDIGTGKTNTATMLAKSDYITGTISSGHTIWYYINNIRTANTNGCSDWFMPSKEELQALRSSTAAPSWFSSYELWSSSEDVSSNSWSYYWNGLSLGSAAKTSEFQVVAVRAF